MADEAKTKAVNLNGKQEQDVQPLVFDEVQKEIVASVRSKAKQEGYAEVVANIKQGVASGRDQAWAGQQMLGKQLYGERVKEAAQRARREKMLSSFSPAQRAELERARRAQGIAAGNAQVSMNSAAQRTEAAGAESRTAVDDSAQKAQVREQQARALKMQAQVRQRAQAVKAQLKSQLQREKAQIDAFTVMLVIMAFTVALVADVLEVILDATVVGAVVASIVGFLASLAVGFLWWTMGAGDFSGRMKKVGKRTMLTLGAETLVSFMPWLTIECILNLLDLLGFFEMNKATQEIKSVIS